MTQQATAQPAGEAAGGGNRTVVVGVKLDSQSRELLTWALVKVAQPGDRVIALHVLGSDIVDRDGKSSLLSLVKAFDSVLAVYEGFCNLKQVDLKLKICRGSSVKKILVREANGYSANELIVGTASRHHKIRSSVLVAKYCAKKLPKACSIIAVSNGKVVFQREASSDSMDSVKGIESQHRNGILGAIQRTVNKNSKILNDGNLENTLMTSDQKVCGKLELAMVKAGSGCGESALRENCSICFRNTALRNSSCAQSTEERSGDGVEENSLAIVPVQQIEAASSSISLLMKEIPGVRPGWPLLRRAILSKRRASDSYSVRMISVVQWAMRIPSRQCLVIENSDPKETRSDSDKDQPSELDGESGAIVLVGDETDNASSSKNSSVKILPVELEGLHEKYSATCRLFKYQELLSATSSFNPDNIIGKGGSSQVCRGCLPDGKEVAVKILKPSEDALKEFVREIEIITTLHHNNIISLFGFCYEDNNLLLVYDFLSRGSLEENLHGNKKDSLAFGWNERLKVAVGVADALAYLHDRSDKPVIHRDVKSSNILLSDDFEPQLSDFGLAKWASTTSSYITCTDVAGTFGYLAPEYFMYGKVNEKIDIYSFGVVLLELLSGRKPISNDSPKGQESIVIWAKPILNDGKFTQLLDPCLAKNYDHDQLERMVLAAALCIRRAPRARPHMSTVLKLLRGDIEVTKWARLQVNASDMPYMKPQDFNGPEGPDALDDEAFSLTNLRSHLNLALLDVEEESLSVSSIERSVSLEDYLRGRWSRSSSFD